MMLNNECLCVVPNHFAEFGFYKKTSPFVTGVKRLNDTEFLNV